jgi:tetratricopeptide (TPR) repeat protein
MRSLVIIIAALYFAPVARAQSAEAEALFSDGTRLMAAGQLAEACEAFEASNRIESRAGTLIRLGECREQSQQLASAWSAYKDALTRVRDPQKRALAESKVAQLEPRLSYLIVSVPDESRIDGLVLTRNGKPLDPGLWNRAVPVDGGTYKISGKAPGHEEWWTIVDVPTDAGKVSVDVPRFKELAKLIAPPAIIADEVHVGRMTRRRQLAIGVAGIGVVALVAGIALGSQARGRQSDAFALCPDAATPCADASHAQALLDQGHARALEANLAFGVSAGAALGAAVLWYLGAPRGTTLAIAPTANGAAFVGHF